MLSKFGAELELRVLAHLDGLSLTRLQHTSRRYHKLITKSKKSLDIWKACLENHCLTNGLFSPSYDDLSTLDEVRRACTTGARLCRVYERGAATRSPLPSKTTSITLAPDVGHLQDFYVIPGGRFVVAVANTQVSLLDLRSGDPGTPETTFKIDDSRYGVAAVGVAGESKVHVLVSRTSSTLHKDKRSRQYIMATTCKVLEIRFGRKSNGDDEEDDEDAEDDEDGGEGQGLRIREKASLTVSHLSETVKLFSVLDGMVLFHEDSGMSLIWDPTENDYVVCQPRIGEISEIVSKDDMILYADNEGIHGVDFQGLSMSMAPVEDDFASLTDVSFGPCIDPLCFSATHKYEADTSDDSSPRLFYSSGSSQPVIYELPVKDEKNSLSLHRYRLAFDADEPSESTLELVEVVEADEASGMEAEQNASFDGRVATMWMDGGGDVGFLSVSSAHLERNAPESVQRTTKLGLVELPNSSSLESEVGLRFCPASGTLINYIDGRLEVYKFD